MAQAISCWLRTAEARRRSQTSPCQICDVHSGSMKKFLSEDFGLAPSESSCQRSIQILFIHHRHQTVVHTITYSRAGQLQPTGGSHNSLRSRLKAALVYTYIERGGGIEFTRTPLFTNNKLH
jgi:hypothetical protein